ncbi:unnamed protein product, partial [Amoebophrya sp. A25]
RKPNKAKEPRKRQGDDDDTSAVADDDIQSSQSSPSSHHGNRHTSHDIGKKQEQLAKQALTKVAIDQAAERILKEVDVVKKSKKQLLKEQEFAYASAAKAQQQKEQRGKNKRDQLFCHGADDEDITFEEDGIFLDRDNDFSEGDLSPPGDEIALEEQDTRRGIWPARKPGIIAPQVSAARLRQQFVETITHQR